MPVRTAAIALGANLGDRLASLQSAATRLGTLGRELGRSPVYESAPVGPPQPDYLNAVLLLETSAEAETLLQGLLSVEAQMGRIRRERWGPRTIDLDLLALGDLRLETPLLTLPHPEIARRAFVLRPWLDVSPDGRVPGGPPLAELWTALPEADRHSLRVHAHVW